MNRTSAQALRSVREAKQGLVTPNGFPLPQDAMISGALPEVKSVTAWLAEELPTPVPVLEGILDRGMKAVIIGPSKAQKTWFVLQMAISLATGRRFIHWETVRQKVLLVNLEVGATHFLRRVSTVCRTMGIPPTELENHLDIMNARGHDLSLDGDQQTAENLIRLVNHKGYEVVIFDPFYKLMVGDENLARDVKVVLKAFDQICTQTGAAVFYVHHDAKGKPGERAKIDRGAGSNVIQRDMDAAICLTPQNRQDKSVVDCGVVVRNYPSVDNFSIEWRGGVFLLSNEPPGFTSNGQKAKEPPPGTDDALRILGSQAVTKATARELLTSNKFTVRGADAAIDGLVAEERLAIYRKNGRGKIFVGTPQAIEKYKAKTENAG